MLWLALTRICVQLSGGDCADLPDAQTVESIGDALQLASNTTEEYEFYIYGEQHIVLDLSLYKGDSLAVIGNRASDVEISFPNQYGRDLHIKNMTLSLIYDDTVYAGDLTVSDVSCSQFFPISCKSYLSDFAFFDCTTSITAEAFNLFDFDKPNQNHSVAVAGDAHYRANDRVVVEGKTIAFQNNFQVAISAARTFLHIAADCELIEPDCYSLKLENSYAYLSNSTAAIVIAENSRITGTNGASIPNLTLIDSSVASCRITSLYVEPRESKIHEIAGLEFLSIREASLYAPDFVEPYQLKSMYVEGVDARFLRSIQISTDSITVVNSSLDEKSGVQSSNYKMNWEIGAIPSMTAYAIPGNLRVYTDCSHGAPYSNDEIAPYLSKPLDLFCSTSDWSDDIVWTRNMMNDNDAVMNATCRKRSDKLYCFAIYFNGYPSTVRPKFCYSDSGPAKCPSGATILTSETVNTFTSRTSDYTITMSLYVADDMAVPIDLTNVGFEVSVSGEAGKLFKVKLANSKAKLALTSVKLDIIETTTTDVGISVDASVTLPDNFKAIKFAQIQAPLEVIVEKQIRNAHEILVNAPNTMEISFIPDGWQLDDIKLTDIENLVVVDAPNVISVRQNDGNRPLRFRGATSLTFNGKFTGSKLIIIENAPAINLKGKGSYPVMIYADQKTIVSTESDDWFGIEELSSRSSEEVELRPKSGNIEIMTISNISYHQTVRSNSTVVVKNLVNSASAIFDGITFDGEFKVNSIYLFSCNLSKMHISYTANFYDPEIIRLHLSTLPQHVTVESWIGNRKKNEKIYFMGYDGEIPTDYIKTAFTLNDKKMEVGFDSGFWISHSKESQMSSLAIGLIAAGCISVIAVVSVAAYCIHKKKQVASSSTLYNQI